MTLNLSTYTPLIISLIIDSVLQYTSQSSGALSLLTLSFIGNINAPWVDGLDTKSNAISSKSGWTSCAGTSPSSSATVSTDPRPLEDIPNLIPA